MAQTVVLHIFPSWSIYFLCFVWSCSMMIEVDAALGSRFLCSLSLWRISVLQFSISPFTLISRILTTNLWFLIYNYCCGIRCAFEGLSLSASVFSGFFFFFFTPVCIFLTFVKVILCLSLPVHSFCFLFFSRQLMVWVLGHYILCLLFAVISACFCMWVISLFFQHALSHTKGGMSQTTGDSQRNILSNRSCRTWLEKGFSYLRIAFQGMLSTFQRMMYVRGQSSDEGRSIVPFRLWQSQGCLGLEGHSPSNDHWRIIQGTPSLLAFTI